MYSQRFPWNRSSDIFPLRLSPFSSSSTWYRVAVIYSLYRSSCSQRAAIQRYRMAINLFIVFSLEMEGQKRTMAARRSHAAKYLKINAGRLVYCQYSRRNYFIVSLFSRNLFLEISWNFVSNSFAHQLFFHPLFLHTQVFFHIFTSISSSICHHQRFTKTWR